MKELSLRLNVSLAELHSSKFLANALPPAVKGIPSSVDFSFAYVPSVVTLFRFSALMFNAHHIHLDKEYSQKKEGYQGDIPIRLVITTVR